MDDPDTPTPAGTGWTIRLALLAVLLLPVVAVLLVLLSTLFGWRLPIGNPERHPVPVQAPGKY